MEYMIYLLLGGVIFGSAAYYLGYDAGKASDERILDGITRQRDQLAYQQRQLTGWVQRNWPDELAAYDNGWDSGYGKGLVHGPALEEEN
jgi:hypothetical protein